MTEETGRQSVESTAKLLLSTYRKMQERNDLKMDFQSQNTQLRELGGARPIDTERVEKANSGKNTEGMAALARDGGGLAIFIQQGD